MAISRIINLLQDFVTYCTEPGRTNHLELLAKCDRILAAIHDVPEYECVTDSSDPPETTRDYQTTRKAVCLAFPDFGYYNVPEFVVQNIANSEVLVGDAIDDITDIVNEFTDVLWRLQQTSVEDAMWHLRFGYATHWGRHMRCLQFYLDRYDRDDESFSNQI